MEDTKAKTRKGKGVHPWNIATSPMQVGKRWFYGQVEGRWSLSTRAGDETYQLRDVYGLKKVYDKLSEDFEAHCVDSWVLANEVVGGHTEPDSRDMLYVTPLQFHRRQLHRLQPEKGGVRKPYGGTMSLGFKRGSWVKHPRHGLTYVGGHTKGRISLHSLETGTRICRTAKPEDLSLLCYASWRIHRKDI